MNQKKRKKLEHSLMQGKVISGFIDSLNEDRRIITTMVYFSKTSEKLFKVEIEVFFADIDIKELNLKDEEKLFSNLEDAIIFIKNKTQVKFIEMKII